MKITVIGGGNMGSLLAVKLSQKHSVTLFLNAPYERVEEYRTDMVAVCDDTGAHTVGRIDRITDDLPSAVEGAEYVFITYPSFLFARLAAQLTPCLSAGQHLVLIPGSGGAELFFGEALTRGCTLTGLQRTHSVARISERGREVHESGVRTGLHAATLPAEFGKEACRVLSDLYGLPTAELSGYLNITLINSNPLLHTSRLYSIFSEYPACESYSTLPLFYEMWDERTSELLIAMDAELFAMLDRLSALGVHVREITTLLDHYESRDARSMTEKITSIRSLKGLATPHVVREDGRLLPDLASRYFTADFPYGLDILLSFAETLGVPCPHMTRVSDWYHRVSGVPRTFSLKDFGLADAEDVCRFYLR